jgi:profilin
MSEDEVATIVASFKDASKIRQNGIYISGEKYFALRADDRSVYGKKVTKTHKRDRAECAA